MSTPIGYNSKQTMRPALERLLSRPASLDLLRCLVGNPALLISHAPASRSPQCYTKRKSNDRRFTSVAMAVQESGDSGLEGASDCESQGTQHSVQSKQKLSAFTQNDARKAMTVSNEAEGRKSDCYSPWSSRLWKQDELEFQSNLAENSSSSQRLLDLPEHCSDLTLFAFLLDYRQGKLGLDGVSMYWEAVKKRGILLETQGSLSEKLWRAFLKLGFQDGKVLDEVCLYAERLLSTTGRRWSKLYVAIIEHLLLNSRGSEALEWHHRLFEKHAPGPKPFADLCRNVVLQKGDLAALKDIYLMNKHRNAYPKIVPVLCEQEDFKSAMEWHFRLITMGDVPSRSKYAEPLVHFLAIYDRRNAIRVTQSLVEAGVSFGITSTLKENVKISREIMNLIHGEVFRVPVKAYNDELGARWFATKWVSLDMAINAVHTLGIQQIGPLSLQAICLREIQPYRIIRRIEHLRELGIGIGDSVFSRAVKHFAQNRMFDYLEGLLNSDQHPDALEDWKLQEALLASFAKNKDWVQYRRTLAIRLIGKKAPAMEAQNVWLRSQVMQGDIPAALETLEKMQLNGTVVKTTTIAYILQNMLRPRQRGRRPMPSPRGANDLDMTITVLKGITKTGNLVPAAYWREIVRRLGMLGRMQDLHDICLFLAFWYGPNNKSYIDHTGKRRPHRFQLPAQVSTSHPLHPLKILFPVSLQKAIVEWGFIYALKRGPSLTKQSTELASKTDAIRQVTSGITLLRQLHQQGIQIDVKAVRKAIFNRLVTYYGPGRSNKPSNRIARAHHIPELKVMARQIDDAMGGQTFGKADMKELIQSGGRLRIRRRFLKANRLAAPAG